MDDVARVDLAPFAPALLPRSPGLQRFRRWLSTQNPFYLLSAWLVFFGLRWSFGPGTSLQSSAALFTGLLVYTLLLALAAVVVVRFAQVWDDARSMLLLVVLMFVGTSIALDETLVAQTNVGRLYYAAAWLVAVVTSEGVLRGVRLRLPGWYRVAYHALLALFFWYPVVLTPWFGDPTNPRLQWMLFAFTPVAASCFALLWPAVCRGGADVRGNGSPWPWPLYPWSLYAILALCCAGRAYYLCLSFHFVGAGDTIFGPYFLLPLLWCLAGLWTTGAARAGRATVAQALLMTPVLWTCLAGWHSSGSVYGSFLTIFVETFHASPLYVGLLAALVYYVFARMLSVRGADFGLTLCFAVLSLVAPRSHTLGSFTTAVAWPWFAAAAWQGWFALRDHHSGRALAAAALTSIAVDRWLAAAPAEWRMGVVYHLMLGVILILGYVGRDELSRQLRLVVAPCGLLGCLIGLWHADTLFPGRAAEFQIVYGTGMSIVALACAGLVRLRVYALVAACVACGAIVAGVWPWYSKSRVGAPGLDYLFLGVCCLLLGLWVSFAKAGRIASGLRWLSPSAWLKTEEP